MRKAPISEITCEYNEGVSCTDYPDCGKCGWNPDNIEARKEKAKEKYLNGLNNRKVSFCRR